MPRIALTIWRWDNGWQFVYGNPERYIWISRTWPFVMRSRIMQRTGDEPV